MKLIRLIFILWLLSFLYCNTAISGQPTLIKDLNSLPNSRVDDLCSDVYQFEGGFYFCALTESGPGFWRTDGTAGATTLVSDKFAPSSMYEFLGNLYFVDRFTNNLYRFISDTEQIVLIKEFSTALIFTELNGNLLLVASDGVSGNELWITDGTSGGTFILKDINVGSRGSGIETAAGRFAKLDNKLFFVADDFVNGEELWVTEGTQESTNMVADIRSGFAGSDPRELRQFGNQLIFFASDGSVGPRLWISDGSSSGTTKIKPSGATLDSYSCPEGRLIVLDDKVLFCAGFSPQGAELWIIDGTTGGTVLLKDLNPSGSSSPSFLMEIGSNAFFIATVDNEELWVTDGSDQGTIQLTAREDISLRDIYPIGSLGAEMIFVAEMEDVGVGLWVTDVGNSAVTLIKDLDPSSNRFIPIPSPFTSSDTELIGSSGFSSYFIVDADYDKPTTLWKTDGTSSGTVELGSFPRIDSFNRSLDSEIRYFSGFDDIVFFGADDPNSANIGRMWVDADNVLEVLREFVPSNEVGTRSSSVSNMVQYGDAFFFLTNTVEDFGAGLSLWRSGGTSDTTFRLMDLCDLSCQFEDAEIQATSNGVFVLVENQDLWFSDGSKEGTQLLKQVGDPEFSIINKASKLTSFNDTLIFVGWDSENGEELWKSDGTTEGTMIVKDINPGSGGSFRAGRLENLTNFVVLNDNLFFVADDGVSGPELWRSGGTEQSTTIVKDIFTFGDFGSYPQDLTVLNDSLLFSAFDLENGYELWTSNGEDGNATLVKDIEPSEFTVTVNRLVCETTANIEICRFRDVEEERPYSSLPKSLKVLNNKAIFWAYTKAAGYELWVTDGTSSGTQILKSLSPGVASSVDFQEPPEDGDFEEDLENINLWKESITIGNSLYFAALPSPGVIELWKTDATVSGTERVVRIQKDGPLALRIEEMALNPLNGQSFFFTLTSSDGGSELWISDGTAQGTLLFPDQVDPELVEFEDLFFFDGRLFFSADNQIKGNSLWALTPDTDYDGIDDPEDNCQLISNPDQANFDADAEGDICDDDDDNDGVSDSLDVFPFDPFESVDTDEDGVGNNADEDDDNDLVNDFDVMGEPLDNCPLDFNPEQEDTDMDGVGDVCEDDESVICVPIATKSGLAVICI
jgi:ELWxxDGT repeat protein